MREILFKAKRIDNGEWFDLEHFEVVGNIFDNPELLQEELDE